MTLEEILASKKVFLSPSDIAPMLRCDAQCIRKQAQQNPAKLGFPIVVMGSRIRIPRIPFLRYWGYY